MLRTTGIPSACQVAAVLPSSERLCRGPVAILECFERIPCDPCHSSCPVGAVASFEDINDLPRIDHDKCHGCGACVAACPGLAIFVIDMAYSADEAVVRIPYEFRPLPETGGTVGLMNREGLLIGNGRVARVQTGKARAATPVVWVAMPKRLALDARHITLLGGATNE